MHEQIGATAGKIWTVLKKNGESSISQLPKTLREREPLVYQAVGWLAREGKIAYRVQGNRTFVSLTD